MIQDCKHWFRGFFVRFLSLYKIHSKLVSAKSLESFWGKTNMSQCYWNFSVWWRGIVYCRSSLQGGWVQFHSLRFKFCGLLFIRQYCFVAHRSDPRGFRFYCLFSIVLVLLFYCFIADKRFYSFIADNSFTVLLLFYCFIADKRYYCFTVLLQIKGITVLLFYCR